jgi:hypothetical protein
VARGRLASHAPHVAPTFSGGIRELRLTYLILLSANAGRPLAFGRLEPVAVLAIFNGSDAQLPFITDSPLEQPPLDRHKIPRQRPHPAPPPIRRPQESHFQPVGNSTPRFNPAGNRSNVAFMQRQAPGKSMR